MDQLPLSDGVVMASLQDDDYDAETSNAGDAHETREGSVEIPGPQNTSSISAKVEEVSGDNSNTFLGELDAEDLVEGPVGDFDFGVEIPEFRPYQEWDPARHATTRLCIKAISTENFKSYYGMKFMGPFDQKFTAVIGPNGCGKSNTIDALLFVFGFRSAKLRAQKLPELIHNSHEHKDCASAKVTVHFAVMKVGKE